MEPTKETFHRGRAMACLYSGRGMYWLLNLFFQDKIDLLREELGPSVYKGLMRDRHYLLLTAQLEIIANITGVDSDFWHEGQALVNRRRTLADLHQRSREIFKGVELQPIPPAGDHTGRNKTTGPFYLELAGLKPDSDDAANLEIILGMFILNLKSDKHGTKPPKELMESWNRAKARFSPLQIENPHADIISDEDKQRALEIIKIILEECGPEGIKQMKEYNRSVCDNIILKRIKGR